MLPAVSFAFGTAQFALIWECWGLVLFSGGYSALEPPPTESPNHPNKNTSSLKVMLKLQCSFLRGRERNFLCSAADVSWQKLTMIGKCLALTVTDREEHGHMLYDENMHWNSRYKVTRMYTSSQKTQKRPERRATVSWCILSPIHLLYTVVHPIPP